MRTPADRLLSQFDALVSEVPTRHYTIGIPATVTVGEDGSVEVTVDLSEVYQAPEEYDANPLYDHNDKIIEISEEHRYADSHRIHQANIDNRITLRSY